MPRPDNISKQSAEEWFRIFRAVADGLITIYRNAGQVIVGQWQALATIPAVRIATECQNVEEAQQLIIQTIGDLESECQAAEAVFNSKRGNMPIEDYYALLLEKERKAKLGRTTIMKKFIAELPDGIKTATQKEFKKVRKDT